MSVFHLTNSCMGYAPRPGKKGSCNSPIHGPPPILTQETHFFKEIRPSDLHVDLWKRRGWANNWPNIYMKVFSVFLLHLYGSLLCISTCSCVSPSLSLKLACGFPLSLSLSLCVSLSLYSSIPSALSLSLSLSPSVLFLFSPSPSLNFSFPLSLLRSLSFSLCNPCFVCFPFGSVLSWVPTGITLSSTSAWHRQAMAKTWRALLQARVKERERERRHLCIYKYFTYISIYIYIILL